MASAEVQMAINEDFNTTLTKELAIKQTYRVVQTYMVHILTSTAYKNASIHTHIKPEE